MQFYGNVILLRLYYMNPTKRKKITYVPGMISLLTIPFIFLYFGKKQLAQIRSFYAMEVNWYNEKITTWYIPPPERQYLDISLTGNADSNAFKILFGELYIKEIHAKKDTIHGVNFHFTSKSKYAEFVRVLDLTNINCVSYFIVSDDNIRMMYYEKERVLQNRIIVQPIYL